MGRPKINRGAYPLLRRKDQESSFMSSIHRARVSDVHVDKGTVNVVFESLPYSREVTIPLLGLSVPPKSSEDDKNYLRSSWGRYIPQVGDVLMIAFGSDGSAYALGYHAMFYEGMDQFDSANEARGGIGWGVSSGREALQPGDWDFKSARNSSLYIGNRARLASGPHSITINKPTGDITTITTLLVDLIGEASEIRHGGARRRVLPTDRSETDIRSARGGVAQEINESVKFGGTDPAGTEIVRESIGDVIDEDLFIPMLGESGQYVRKFISIKDLMGVMEVYNEKVDTGGNSMIESNLATKFSWNTPLAAWDVTNLSTKIESTSTIDFHSVGPASFKSDSTLDLEATAAATLKSNVSVALEAPSISLGQAASEPVLKGQTLMSAFNTLFGQMTGDWAALQAHPVVGIGANSVAAISTFLAQLANYMSVKVKTE